MKFLKILLFFESTNVAAEQHKHQVKRPRIQRNSDAASRLATNAPKKGKKAKEAKTEQNSLNLLPTLTQCY